MQIDQFNSASQGRLFTRIVAIKSPKFNDFKLKTFSLLDFYANFLRLQIIPVVTCFQRIFS